jgi:hypothetical protein
VYGDVGEVTNEAKESCYVAEDPFPRKNLDPDFGKPTIDVARTSSTKLWTEICSLRWAEIADSARAELNEAPRAAQENQSNTLSEVVAGPGRQTNVGAPSPKKAPKRKLESTAEDSTEANAVKKVKTGSIKMTSARPLTTFSKRWNTLL